MESREEAEAAKVSKGQPPTSPTKTPQHQQGDDEGVFEIVDYTKATPWEK